MLIVHITSVHNYRDNRILFKECASLVARGHKVILIAQGDVEETIAGVVFKPVPPPPTRFHRMLNTTRQVVTLALSLKPDIIHVHDPELMPYAWWLTKRGFNVVYDMHELVPKQILHKVWIHPSLTKSISALFGFLERRIINSLPVIFAEHSYGPHYPKVSRHETVLNMPDSSFISTLKVEKTPIFTVGYIGGVTKDRGTPATIKAIAHLRDDGHEIELLTIGRCFDSRLLEELESRDWITFHPFMAFRDAASLIAQCHIGIAVLRPIPNYLQSYPTKIFEYMAMGLPVITSNFPLYEKIIADSQTGLCVDPDNIEEIASAILTLKESNEMQRTFSRNGIAASKTTYNWDIEADKLEAAYRRWFDL